MTNPSPEAIERDRRRVGAPPTWFMDLLWEVAQAEGITEGIEVEYHRTAELVTGHFEFWPEPAIVFWGPDQETPRARQLALHELAHWVVGPRGTVTISPTGVWEVETIWHGPDFYEAAWRLYQRHAPDLVLKYALPFEIGYQGHVARESAIKAGIISPAVARQFYGPIPGSPDLTP